jgi:hypothetical protein
MVRVIKYPNIHRAGACDALTTIFRRVKQDLGDHISFYQAQSDQIEVLAKYRGHSRPCFLFFFGQTLVKVINGANSPAIEKTIHEQLDIEKSGGIHVALLDLSFAPSVRTGLIAKAEGGSNADVTQTASSAALNLSSIEHTLAFIKPDAMHPSTISEIFDTLKRNRIDIVSMKKVWLNREQVS